MSWRVAKSLDKLLAQLNAKYPHRSKSWDGSIGDTAHSSRVSDHNPDRYGVVRARDYTHDPKHGLNSYALAERLRLSRDPRIKYIISNGRICSATVSPWRWRRYNGANRHDHHVHVSVVGTSRADGTSPWAAVDGKAPAKSAGKKAKKKTGLTVDGKLGPATIRQLQRVLKVTIDGKLGPATAKALQRRLKVKADGKLGPATIRALQKRLKVNADGILGRRTITALQKRLNKGKI